MEVVLNARRTQYAKICCAGFGRGMYGMKSDMITVERQAASAEVMGTGLALNHHTLSSRSLLASTVHLLSALDLDSWASDLAGFAHSCIDH